MANTPTGTVSPLLAKLLTSMHLASENVSLTPMITDDFSKTNEEVSLEDRFLSGLAAILFNIDTSDGRFEKGKILETMNKLDELVNKQLNAVFHHPTFQQAEATWRGIEDLATQAGTLSLALRPTGSTEVVNARPIALDNPPPSRPRHGPDRRWPGGHPQGQFRQCAAQGHRTGAGRRRIAARMRSRPRQA